MKRIFIRGLLLTIPVGAFIFLMAKFYGFLHGITGALFDVVIPEGTTLIPIVQHGLVWLMIVFFIFLLGWLSGFDFTERILQSLEDRILNRIPGYRMLRYLSEEVSGAGAPLKVVYASVDDGIKLGLLMEELEDGRKAVFLPDSPVPTSGSLVILEPHLVEASNLTVSAAIDILRSGKFNLSHEKVPHF
jgi:uncharacterized membrane protein